jgi:hypothetical protein
MENPVAGLVLEKHSLSIPPYPGIRKGREEEI